MGKRPSSFGFRLMALELRMRDFFLPRENIIREVGIMSGFQVLDYGCGPGSYIDAVVKLVGVTGKIYALDAHPLAMQTVQDLITRNQYLNVVTILSNCETGLPDDCIDVVLLYDVLHSLKEPDSILAELRRVLRPDGIISMNDHHLKEAVIISKMTGNGMFKLSAKETNTYSFIKS